MRPWTSESTLEEPITVELVDGTPTVFWWDHFACLIESLPLAFYRRRPPWWTGESNPCRRHVGFWRVNASRDDSGEPPKMYDLRNDERE